MKTNLFVAAASIIIVFASCSSTKQTSSGTSDDLYVNKTPSAEPTYTPAPAPDQSQTEYSGQDMGGNSEQKNSNPDYSNSDQYQDANGTTYVTNNYYNNNDGWYSSQLNHWYSPYVGFSYFSPYYGGISYYDPFYYSPGFSISFGIGFGWGSYYNYYNPYYSPWYGYGYGYYPWYGPGYGYGYNNGCWNNYGYGYCGYGDGGYNYSNSYYGYHGSSSGNTSADEGGRHYKMANDDNGSGPVKPVFGGSRSDDVQQLNRGTSGSHTSDQNVRSPRQDNNDRNISVPDRGVSVPDRQAVPDRNVTPSKENNNGRPRQANFTQAINHSTQFSAINHQQQSSQNGNNQVRSGQGSQQQQNYVVKQQQSQSVRPSSQQQQNNFYAENRNYSPVKSSPSQHSGYSNQSQKNIFT